MSLARPTWTTITQFSREPLHTQMKNFCRGNFLGEAQFFIPGWKSPATSWFMHRPPPPPPCIRNFLPRLSPTSHPKKLQLPVVFKAIQCFSNVSMFHFSHEKKYLKYLRYPRLSSQFTSAGPSDHNGIRNSSTTQSRSENEFLLLLEKTQTETTRRKKKEIIRNVK